MHLVFAERNFDFFPRKELGGTMDQLFVRVTLISNIYCPAAEYLDHAVPLHDQIHPPMTELAYRVKPHASSQHPVQGGRD